MVKTAGSGRALKKRLIVNCDGTGQSEYTGGARLSSSDEVTSPPVSNVARIGRALLLEDEEHKFQQIAYYQAGVGAEAESTWYSKIREGGLGIGLVSNIREAYGFICNNYDFGDEIYITGFSRGAFTARSVAGLIGRCGILTKKGLDHFYEAFDFYQKYEDPKGKKICPVTDEAGTTRTYDHDIGPEAAIKIKAVGVWDTVGGLRGNHAFHDVGLGDHIENAYHMLSLNEQRTYFGPTLWENVGGTRSIQGFEQCWMAGDHSNVGGSWDDQQLADIALAWMMSRFSALGVKFDDSYLYREYAKFKNYVIKETGQGGSYSLDDEMKALNPRQWGEGRCKEISGYKYYAIPLYGGNTPRTPMKYTKKESTALLQHTNETVHPVVRYRRFCKNQKRLGTDDEVPFNPVSLNGWTPPSAQKDGRVGYDSPVTSKGPLAWKNTQENVSMEESSMGKYEKILLAIYDQDPELQNRDGSIWKKVLGGNGPPKDIKNAVAEIVRIGD